MVDKYGTGDDPLCYSGTTVLRNLLDIKDSVNLDDAEAEISLHNSLEIPFSQPPYTLEYMCAIHRTLFCDLYEWAGELRTIDISKGSTRFCHAAFIEREAAKIFNGFAQKGWFETLNRFELTQSLAELYGELNMVHPFREGNGRVQRILFEHILANCGYEVSWTDILKEEWVSSNIAAVGCDYSKLETIFDSCIFSV